MRISQTFTVRESVVGVLDFLVLREVLRTYYNMFFLEACKFSTILQELAGIFRDVDIEVCIPVDIHLSKVRYVGIVQDFTFPSYVGKHKEALLVVKELLLKFFLFLYDCFEIFPAIRAEWVLPRRHPCWEAFHHFEQSFRCDVSHAAPPIQSR